MEKFIKYLKKFLKEIDVSPFDSDNSLRLLIYAVWGFSVITFLGSDLSRADAKFSYSNSTVQSINCIVLKKVITHDINVEHFTLIKTSTFVVITPRNYELPSSDFEIPRCSRAPPGILFS